MLEVFGGSVVTGVLGGLSGRRRAKRQARQEQEALRLNYNFSMNDNDREMLMQQEMFAVEKFNSSIEKNSFLTELSYGQGTRSVDSSTESNLQRIVNTNNLINQMKMETNFETSLDEYRRFKENERFNLERGIQSSRNAIPSFLEAAMGGAISGASQGASALFSGAGGV